MATKTHGEIRRINGKRVASPEYRSWQMMKNRCFNPRAEDYAYYGARGITISAYWWDFEGFLADMGRRPGPLYTLERKDVNGNYDRDNCVWATRETQARNRPYARTKSWELAEALGIKRDTAAHIIFQVRALDRGDTKWFALSPELELQVRMHLESVGG